MISLNLVKQLRESTGAGMLDCQKALEESKGDMNKAVEILRKKGEKIAEVKQGRSTKEGVVEAYIHSNKKIGVLVELVCETDFVARNEEFKILAHDLAMQVAATDPKWLSPAEVPQEIIDKEKEIYKESLPKGKPQAVLDKILEGKLKTFYSENCLLKQPFIKDDKIIIDDLVKQLIAKLKENIQVRRFIRFSL